MKLFIIGNGFDLAHRLPTQYWDFRTYLQQYHHEFLRDFEQHYSIFPGDSDEQKREILWNYFETNLANINDDIIVEDAVGIDMWLDGGDVGIEDTLYEYFQNEYKYIENLSTYLKRWVQGIKIIKAKPITTKINSLENNYYITFNYTSTLEKLYKIDSLDILHIHGSLYNSDPDPIIGHGNTERLEAVKYQKEDAEREFNEKKISIYKVIDKYYNQTFKDISKYMHKLWSLKDKPIDEINVIGHCVCGIDLPYFRYIDYLTNQRLIWNVYFFEPEEESQMRKAMQSQGIENERIKTYPTSDFYDLQNK